MTAFSSSLPDVTHKLLAVGRSSYFEGKKIGFRCNVLFDALLPGFAELSADLTARFCGEAVKHLTDPVGQQNLISVEVLLICDH